MFDEIRITRRHNGNYLVAIAKVFPPESAHTLPELIMQAVEAGGRKVHNKYLPEVLALVSQKKLVLLRANRHGIEVILASAA
jgi:hypothetical protein